MIPYWQKMFSVKIILENIEKETGRERTRYPCDYHVGVERNSGIRHIEMKIVNEKSEL